MTQSLVLIADNDRAVSSLLVEVLARHGLRTVCAYDGEAAAVLLADPAVRVLVCDLDMPKRSGVEVLEGLVGVAAPPRTIVVSGYLDGALQAKLQANAFVVAVLKKPFDLFAFARLVCELAVADESGPAAGAEL